MYGYHRTNIVTDEKIEVGVFAYGDISEIIPVNRKQDPGSEHYVIGVLSGYLMKTDRVRRHFALGPRSCRTEGVFAPLDVTAQFPWVMPEEDRLACRLDPLNLGAATTWSRKIADWKDKNPISALNNNMHVWNDNKLPQHILKKANKLFKETTGHETRQT